MTRPTVKREMVSPRDRTTWRRWFRRHHGRDAGVWLTVAKKNADVPGVAYEEAVEEALCFGWIDSTANRLDTDRYLLWMAPRKPTSVWSAINKRRVERLIREGRMEAPGFAAIERAKANGSWQALERSDALEIPKDLTSAFRKNPGSRKHFEAFPPSTRKQILWWIGAAKRPETRARRIEQTASLAARNIRVNQWRPGSG